MTVMYRLQINIDCISGLWYYRHEYMTMFWNGIISVSYTHLDVYKRQCLRGVGLSSEGDLGIEERHAYDRVQESEGYYQR